VDAGVVQHHHPRHVGRRESVPQEREQVVAGERPLERDGVEGEGGRLVVRNIGTIISLLIPSDALWRLAAYQLLPSFARDLALTPFTPTYPPSGAMVVWAIGYIAVVAALGIRAFERRAL
jgi:hypothetical protein